MLGMSAGPHQGASDVELVVGAGSAAGHSVEVGVRGVGDVDA